MEEKRIVLAPEGRAEFRNQVDFCVGTGRMGLALHREYLEQLKLVQEEIGFRYIRGHGLFCDDMAIYQETEDGVPERSNSTSSGYPANSIKNSVSTAFLVSKSPPNSFPASV